MKIAATVCRYLLGLIFIAVGISGFLILNNPPPAPPGLAQTFQQVYFASRWVLFVDTIGFIAGVLLVFNMYVPLGLVILAGIITNIYIFHLTMALPGVIAPIVLTALWVFTALPLRASFAPLLARRPAA